MKALSCGIVGLPNVGKSTLFNALLKKKQAGASNYPFCTIDPNVGMIELPDPRLSVLAKISQSEKIVPATLVFVDIAGLVKGASEGEGLGNQFLANVRESNVIIHVVRCFQDDAVIHVSGRVDPLNDIEVINVELILADLQMAENTLQKLQRQAKGDKRFSFSVKVLEKVVAHLNTNCPIRSLTLDKEEWHFLNTYYHFITAKEVIYVANLSESDMASMNNPYYQMVRHYAEKEKSIVIPFSAKLEEELTQLPQEEAFEYLNTLGLEDLGLNRLITVSFDMLGLITFLTTGVQETRAWTITNNTTAQEAAGEIHTDIQRGFVRAEVITFDDMVTYQGRARAKAAGKARLEGKEYIVQDGDVILFFHH